MFLHLSKKGPFYLSFWEVLLPVLLPTQNFFNIDCKTIRHRKFYNFYYDNYVIFVKLNFF